MSSDYKKRSELFDLMQKCVDSEYDYVDKHIETRRERSHVLGGVLVSGLWAVGCFGTLVAVRYKKVVLPTTHLKVAGSIFTGAAIGAHVYADVKYPKWKIDRYFEMSEEFDKLAKTATQIYSGPVLSDKDIEDIERKHACLIYEGNSYDPEQKLKVYKDGMYGYSKVFFFSFLSGVVFSVCASIFKK